MSILRLTRRNRNDYLVGSYPDIKSLKWNGNYPDINILKNFPNLIKLDCSLCKLEDLLFLQYCPQITELRCIMGRLLTNLNGIQFCPNLKMIRVFRNNINDLSHIKYCPQITELECSNNQITDLSFLQYCPLLEVLECSNNQITDLSPLQYCPNLRWLNCSYNLISDFDLLKKFSLLQYLNYNNISTERLDLSKIEEAIPEPNVGLECTYVGPRNPKDVFDFTNGSITDIEGIVWELCYDHITKIWTIPDDCKLN